MRDLEGMNQRQLSKDELKVLLAGARLARVTVRGNYHHWTNEADGTFVAVAPNLGLVTSIGNQRRPSRADGQWHISEDGRYCVVIEWKVVGTEKWCRVVLHTSDGYYMVSKGSDTAHKFEIKK